MFVFQVVYRKIVELSRGQAVNKNNLDCCVKEKDEIEIVKGMKALGH